MWTKGDREVYALTRNGQNTSDSTAPSGDRALFCPKAFSPQPQWPPHPGQPHPTLGGKVRLAGACGLQCRHCKQTRPQYGGVSMHPGPHAPAENSPKESCFLSGKKVPPFISAGHGNPSLPDSAFKHFWKILKYINILNRLNNKRCSAYFFFWWNQQNRGKEMVHWLCEKGGKKTTNASFLQHLNKNATSCPLEKHQ